MFIYSTSVKQIYGKSGKTTYEVAKTPGGQPYDDGIHTVYINAAVNDGSAIAALMQYFKSCDPNDDSRGALSDRIRKLKSDEEGEFMCELTQKWYNDGVKMATANDLISIMDSFKVSIESAMQTLKVPETERVFYVALVDNIRSGKVKCE